MTTFTDEQLAQYGNRVRDKVVVITGGGDGIGRETALCFARFGAKIVIGDINKSATEETINLIEKNGSKASWSHCDVSSWESQRSFFEYAFNTYGSIDIAVANAGIGEVEDFNFGDTDEEGKVKRPDMKTLNINLIGSIYTATLASHYIKTSHSDVRAIIFMGSMASWQAFPSRIMYSASKHGILGLMRSLEQPLAALNIRVATIHPFFVDTKLVRKTTKALLVGVPKTPIDRVALSVLFAATDFESSGSAWLLPDNGLALRLEREILKEGVYSIIDARNKFGVSVTSKVKLAKLVALDVLKLIKSQPLLALFFLPPIYYFFRSL